MIDMSVSEMTLLVILTSEGQLSGYQINKILIERGFREWAGVGSTSIYKGLKRLENKSLIKFLPNIKKIGKGPSANIYSITDKGIEILKNEVKKALSSDTRYNPKYDLAIAVLPIVDKEEAIKSLNERLNKLKKNILFIQKEKFEKQGGDNLPPHVVLLFERSFMLMEMEIKFIRKTIRKIKYREK